MFRSHTLSSTEYEKLKQQAHHMSMFSFFDIRIRIFTNKPDNLDFFRKMYTYFRKDSLSSQLSQAVKDFYVITDYPSASRTILFWSKERCWEILDRVSPLNVVENVIFDTSLSQVTTHYLFHGACFCHEGTGIGICGISGSGKTTLSLELAKRGIHFLSDEIVALGRRDGYYYPFPRLIACDSQTIQLVMPEINGTINSAIRREGSTYYINPIMLSNQNINLNCSARFMIFLESNIPSEGDSREPYSAVEVALLEQSEEFIAETTPLDGVILLRKRKTEHGIEFLTYQVEQKRKQVFRKLCQSFGDRIAYRVHRSAKSPDSKREPRLLELDKKKAMKLMLSYLRNIITPFYFDDQPDPHVVIETTADIFARSMALSFYLLVPGHVGQTADLIENLLIESHQLV